MISPAKWKILTTLQNLSKMWVIWAKYLLESCPKITLIPLYFKRVRFSGFRFREKRIWSSWGRPLDDVIRHDVVDRGLAREFRTHWHIKSQCWSSARTRTSNKSKHHRDIFAKILFPGLLGKSRKSLCIQCYLNNKVGYSRVLAQCTRSMENWFFPSSEVTRVLKMELFSWKILSAPGSWRHLMGRICAPAFAQTLGIANLLFQ